MDVNDLTVIYENMLKLQENLSVSNEILDRMLVRVEAILPDVTDLRSHNLPDRVNDSRANN
ncbi:hypothetical protein [Planctomicrobium sp. SH527]|uniref:hypothetical protein n=1 Tax=Planctomicrobium sp. SH527 TaxID=3448123 RepID=UPI003F5C9FF4